ncbi:TPA: conjugal transfer protein TrbC [Klebsiella aerogenes]|nr:conjugal transfer protein TrbC [Klebsiella aerogenes]
MQQESVDSKKVIRPEGSFMEWFLTPNVQFGLLAILTVLGLFFPFTMLLSILILPPLMVAFTDRKFRPPLRMPKDCEMFDDTLTTETQEEYRLGPIRIPHKVRERKKAKGILYVGYERGRLFGRELWLNMTDLLRHMVFFGTTGSGKTETFYGFIVNYLLWSRGYCLSDGKADNKLAFATWSLARRFGREDDYYVLNLLTGSIDRFVNLVKQESIPAQSNSVNLFSVAPPTFIIQLMESMLPQVGGDSAQWQDTAKAMMSALINALCYKRARGELLLSQRTIQKNMSLPAMAALYVEAKKNGWHSEGYAALESYLENTPGFLLANAEYPETWEARAFEQHNYMSRQFLKTLSLFNETYGHVFPEDSGDIRMDDIFHNDRILIVMIPSLELSRGEAATLGRLYVTLQRMTISKDLGYQLEGKKEEVLLTHALNNQAPYGLIYDELGQYFTSGMDTLSAQMRSLEKMGVFSSQDHPSLARGANGEVDSLIANTRVKYFESIEDRKTFEILRETVGQDYYSELSGQEAEHGTFSKTVREGDLYQIREKDRVNIRELRKQTEGQGVISFQDALVRSAAFYIPDNEKFSSELPMRINRFIEVLPPSPATLYSIYPERKDDELAETNPDAMHFPPIKLFGYDKAANSLLEKIEVFYELQCGAISPEEMSVCLFELFAEWLDGTETDDVLYHQEDDLFPMIEM